MTKPNIPYREIRETENRSWSFKLLTHLTESTTDDDTDQAVETLTILDDHRLMPVLTRIMEDRGAEVHLRSLASEILAGSTTWETPHERRHWWASGDDILMRHVVISAERSETDLIERIVNDASHPYHADAIEKLGIRFEEPRFQILKINAMSHSRADVRAAAARAILWDQPVAAQTGLLRLAKEDNDLVAQEALHALAYYESQLVLQSLFDLAKTGPIQRRELYTKALGYVRQEFIYALEMAEATGPDAERIFKSWLTPVWDILHFSEDKAAEDAGSETAGSPTTKEAKTRRTLNEIIARFDDADGLWADRRSFVSTMDLGAWSRNEQLRFIKFVTDHSDWSVREVCCKALAELNAGDALLQLLYDPVFCVRKNAAYYIRETTRDERIATRLWDMLVNEHIGSAHAQEVLESYVVHSVASNLDDQLYELASRDLRESVRITAIRALSERESRNQVRALVSILSSEPLITWSAHRVLLEACFDLGIAVTQARELCEVDDLSLQGALAEMLAGQVRL